MQSEVKTKLETHERLLRYYKDSLDGTNKVVELILEYLDLEVCLIPPKEKTIILKQKDAKREHTESS